MSKTSIEILGRFLYTTELKRNDFFEYPKEIDELKESDVVINCIHRPYNYELYGKKLKNNVVGFSLCEDYILGEPSKDKIREFIITHKITHIYTTNMELLKTFSDFLDVNIEGFIDKNPYNNITLPKTKYLVHIKISG